MSVLDRRHLVFARAPLESPRIPHTDVNTPILTSRILWVIPTLPAFTHRRGSLLSRNKVPSGYLVHLLRSLRVITLAEVSIP